MGRKLRLRIMEVAVELLKSSGPLGIVIRLRASPGPLPSLSLLSALERLHQY